jgi:hypothetical protein
MDFATISQYGATVVALIIMWRMDDASQKEREGNNRSPRDLESDIRNRLATALMENTNAMLEHSKIMETVVKVLSEISTSSK